MVTKHFFVLLFIYGCSSVSSSEDISDSNFAINADIFPKETNNDQLCEQGLIADCGISCCYDSTRLPGNGVVLKTSLYNPAFPTYVAYDRYGDDPSLPVIVHMNSALLKRLNDPCFILNPYVRSRHELNSYYIGIVCN